MPISRHRRVWWTKDQKNSSQIKQVIKMPTYTKEGIKFNELIEESLSKIRKEFMKLFPIDEEKDVVLILNIKLKGSDFMRAVA